MCLAIPGQIKSIEADTRLAQVEVMGVRRAVSIDLLLDEQPTIGDWVLIHVGFAMSKISAAQAEEQLALLSKLGETAEAREEAQRYGSTEIALRRGAS